MFLTQEAYLNQVITGDCLAILPQLPDNSVDLIFADPPYNLQLQKDLFRPNHTKVEGVADEWDKFDSMQEYDVFTKSWLRECRRVLKKNGAIWVIGSYHNIYRVGAMMQNIGYWFLNDIVWIKTNPMPNFKGTRFNNAHETLIWAAKSQASKYTFHYKAMKVYNDDLQMRSDWYLPICGGKERVKVDGKKAHSTQKPAELLLRIILATSNVGDVILDPFMGSGTTGAVAKYLQRNFIGIEENEEHSQVATKRIEKINPLDAKLLHYKIESKPPKVPFGNLIEMGFVNIGEYLYSKDKIIQAQINANASLEWQGEVGSIHKLSAKATGKKSSNGWTYWYVERGKELVSIDELRTAFAKQFLTA